MAGSVRRKSSPVVAPSAKANNAYPAGTNPCRPKAAAPKRFWFTLSMGLNHHVTIRLRSPADGGAGQPDEPELDQQPAHAAHALRPGQAEGPRLELAGDERRPPEHPDEDGHDEHQRRGQDLQLRVGADDRVVAVAAGAAAGPALRHAQCRRPSTRWGPVTSRMTPRTSSPAPPMNACVRNWRHENAITRAPPALWRARRARAGVAHVGQHDVLEAELLHRPGGIQHRSVAAHEQGALAIGVAFLNDLLPGRE